MHRTRTGATVSIKISTFTMPCFLSFPLHPFSTTPIPHGTFFPPKPRRKGTEMKIQLHVIITWNYENHRKTIKPYLRIEKFYFGRNYLSYLLLKSRLILALHQLFQSLMQEFSKIIKDRDFSASLKNLSDSENSYTKRCLFCEQWGFPLLWFVFQLKEIILLLKKG